MGKSSNSAPAAPSASSQIAAQGAANKEAIETSAKINAVDQFGPGGSVTYGKGEDGIPTSQTVKLGDAEQQFYDTSNEIRNNLGDVANRFTDYLPQDKFSLDDVPNGDRVSNAMFERSKSLYEPIFDQQQDDLALSLSERGIPVGSEVYNNEMDRMGRSQNEAYTSAGLDATLAGGAEEDRLLSRALTERTQPMNELSAALQGAPALSVPQGGGTPAYSMQPVNAIGAMQNQYQGQMNNYNAQRQQQNSIYSGLFNAGTAAMGF